MDLDDEFDFGDADFDDFDQEDDLSAFEEPTPTKVENPLDVPEKEETETPNNPPEVKKEDDVAKKEENVEQIEETKEVKIKEIAKENLDKDFIHKIMNNNLNQEDISDLENNLFSPIFQNKEKCDDKETASSFKEVFGSILNMKKEKSFSWEDSFLEREFLKVVGFTKLKIIEGKGEEMQYNALVEEKVKKLLGLLPDLTFLNKV